MKCIEFDAVEDVVKESYWEDNISATWGSNVYKQLTDCKTVQVGMKNNIFNYVGFHVQKYDRESYDICAPI